jgi:uncharacterized protein YfaS (alpha-2-macroglobulin family)
MMRLVWTKIKQVLKRIRSDWRSLLLSLPGFLFGSLKWTPPVWIGRLFSKASSCRQAFAKKIRANPRKAIKISSATFVLLAGLIGAYIWWENQPKPFTYGFTVDAPRATPLEENAKPNPLSIRFRGSVAKLDQIGKPFNQGVVLSPNFAGTWRWDSESQLTFVPASDWPVGQKFQVKFKKESFPSHILLEAYSTDFETEHFSASINSSELYQNPANPQEKKAVATIKFSHPVDSESLRRHLNLRFDRIEKGTFGKRTISQNLKFDVSYNKFFGEAYIHSEPLSIPDEDSSVVIQLEAGVKSSRGGDGTTESRQKEVKVPGMFTFFHIVDSEMQFVLDENYQQEQIFVLNLSAEALGSEIQKNLSVYLLPEPTEEETKTPKKKRQIASVGEVTQEVLSKSQKIELAAIPTEHEFAEMHSFKLKVPSGRSLYVKLQKGTKSYGGYVLPRDYETIVRIPFYPKALRILGEGSILSLAGERKLSIYSSGLPAIQFEIGRIISSEVHHLVSQTSGRLDRPEFQNYQFRAEDLVEQFSEIRELQNSDSGKPQYTTLDLAPYLNKGNRAANHRGLFFVKAHGWNSKTKQNLGFEESRLILLTDMGVIVKALPDQSREIFVQSIRSGRPVSGATVEILGRNGLPVFTATTDSDGRAHFASLKDFKREQQPVAYLVQKDSDLSFLPFSWQDRHLNLSRFDIGGVQGLDVGSQLVAFLFSERGLYRPGDETHIGYIIKSASWKDSVASIPVEIAVSDPRGVEIRKEKLQLSTTGFGEYSFKTEDSSPTGTYQVSVFIVKDGRRGSLLGTTNVRVEEFLPDRMKISSHLSQERVNGWISPENLKASVSLMNLFGTPAMNRRVVASLSLTPTYPHFSRYPDFQFFDPIQAKKTWNESLSETTTNDSGEAEFDLDLSRFDKATYYLVFRAEGFEAEGGRSVTAQSSALVSPLNYLVGFKSSDELGYLTKNSEHSVQLIAVNSELEPATPTDLKLDLIEERYVSVLTKLDNGTYKYQSVRKEIPIRSEDLKFNKDPINYKLPTDKPGSFVLLIKNQAGTIFNRIQFSVVGEGNLSRTLDRNAELQIKLSRSDFESGDEIEMQIKAPYVGAGLITIERERVYAHKWFTTSSTSSMQTIKIPRELEGNAYVNVTFVRDIHSREIFMSPLSYGVVPFSISRKNRTVSPKIEVASLVKPGDPLKISYSTDKPSKLVIFAVDEGILQVAGYKTPDPLAHFFRKRALEVQTYQLLDLILPELSILQEISGTGGDMKAKELGKNLNPFKRRREKPIVFWSGILEADKTPRSVTYLVPDYFNGSVKVMAVAVSSDAVGAGDQRSTVRGDFVISPNLPTFVAPDDEFEMSVGLSNNAQGSGQQAEVKFEVRPSDQLELKSPATQTFKVDEGKETVATVRVRAKPKFGSASLTFLASWKDKKAKYESTLSVRPAVPFMTTAIGGSMNSGKTEIPVPRKLNPEFRSQEVTVSTLPLNLAHGLVRYLEAYPYGCTEQLLSQVFPALVLRSRPEFGYSSEKVQKALARALQVLQTRQNSDGSFGFWGPGQSLDPFHVVYAVHFMTEAQERGYAMPKEFMNRSIDYLRGLVSREPNSLPEARTRAYAFYVLARNGISEPTHLAVLKQILGKSSWAKEWKTDLTGVYLAAVASLYKQDQEATALIAKSSIRAKQEINYRYYYDELVFASQYLYLLAKHFPTRLKALKSADLIEALAPLNKGYMNSLSASFAILGLDAYVSAVGTVNNGSIKIEEILASAQTALLNLPAGTFPKVSFSENAQKLRVTNEAELPIFYQLTQAGFDLQLPSQEMKEKLEAQREYRLADKVIQTAKLGNEVEVHIKVRALTSERHWNVAIVDILPSGFEVVMDSIRPVREDYGTTSPSHYRKQSDITPQYDEEGRETEGSGVESEGEYESENHDGSEAVNGGGQQNWWGDFVDIREDRVIVFGTVDPNVKEFVYRIKAINRGDFTVPPIFAASMYDPTVKAQGMPAKFKIEGP